MFHIMRPAAYDFVDLKPAEVKRIADLHPEWIYFGTLFHNSRHALGRDPAAARTCSGRQKVFTTSICAMETGILPTVEQLASQANVIKLSDSEAEFLDASWPRRDLKLH